MNWIKKKKKKKKKENLAARVCLFSTWPPHSPRIVRCFIVRDGRELLPASIGTMISVNRTVILESIVVLASTSTTDPSKRDTRVVNTLKDR